MELENLINKDMAEVNAKLLTRMGYAFEKGNTFLQNYEMALRCYELAAQYGDVQAVNNLGWLTLNGFGVERNTEKATEFFLRAAKKRNSTAMVNLGNLYESGTLGGQPDYKQAYFWYKKAADEGDPVGLFNYANCFHHGWGVRKNRKKAFSIFEMLAVEWDETEPDICFYMGLYYQEGYAVARDYTAALGWYEMGAYQDDMRCFNQLGVMYAKGLGVPKDIVKAMEYYQKAAELGDTLAYANVGWLYESSKEFKNMDAALEWYRKGAAEGEEHSVEAMERLGAIE